MSAGWLRHRARKSHNKRQNVSCIRRPKLPRNPGPIWYRDINNDLQQEPFLKWMIKDKHERSE